MRISLLFLFSLLLNCRPLQAQQLQILRSDSSLFESIRSSDYVTLVTLPASQQGWLKKWHPLTGQITRITSDSIRIRTRDALVQLPISKIQGIRKITRLKAYLKNPSSFIAGLGVVVVSQVVTRTLATEGTIGRRFAIGIGASVGVLSLINLAVHVPRLKRIQNGWIFRVVD